MATLASLKKKIAALEAQVEQVTKAEMSSAIAKVRKIMADFGMTIEHLTGEAPSKRAAKKSSGAKPASKSAAKAKGSKPAKYRDPATGSTWTGVGRAPAWIATAKNRDEFLIAKTETADHSAKAAAPAKKAAKRAPSVKRAMAAAAKKASRKAGAAAKRVAKAATGKATAKKAAAKPAPAKKAASKKAVAKAPAGKATRKRAVAKSAPEAAANASADQAVAS